MPATSPPRLSTVATDAELASCVAAAAGAKRVGVDVEASGMFTYRARICTVQLAWEEGSAVVIDALSVSLGGLAALLGRDGPIKIVHDVAFDARLLAEVGLPLDNVHDTALAARMLGRTATGLASLLDSELGVRITKEMQRHDWRARPLDERMLSYLAQDVTHLASLDDRLWSEVEARGVADEVLEETRYRLRSAEDAAKTPETSPAYTRIKGVERLAERELAVLRQVADLREHEAARRDVPPHRVASNEAMLVIARERPRTASQVARVRGVSRDDAGAGAFAESVARAVQTAGDVLPPEERAHFERPRLPAAVVRARRERESRLLAWRRAEAKRRAVDEQVVLPGHCVRDAVDLDDDSVERLRLVPGIGAFRVERDGAAMVAALRGEVTPAPVAEPEGPST